MVPFVPPVSVGSPGGSTILDRIVQTIRRSFESLNGAFLGRPDSGDGGQVLVLGADGLPAWSSATASFGLEQSIQEVVPSIQESDSLANGTTHITTISLQAMRHYWVTATATAWAPDQTVIFSETQFIRVSMNAAALATHLIPDTVSHTYGAGFSLAAATSGGDLTLGLSNSSGTTYAIQVIASLSSARVRS